MKIEQFHAAVTRIENRYAVLLLDDGEEKPVLLSVLPDGIQNGERVCLRNGKWITEAEASRKHNGRLRTLKALLKGE